MKHNYILVMVLIFALSSFQSVKAGHSQQCYDTRTNAKIQQKFKRTFRGACRSESSNKSSTSKQTGFSDYVSLQSFKNALAYKTAERSSKQADILEITYQDFLDHLSLEKSRIALLYEAASLTMDIGNIDSGENETWVLPNLKDLNATTLDIMHVTPESSGVLEDFPDDATHAVYSKVLDIYEIFSLNEFDLFLYGYGEIDEDDEDDDGDFEERIAIDYYGTQSPIPLKLEEEYEGVVTFINDAPEGEELDSLQYTDYYRVIGQGTLKTFDDGDVDAIKLIYREEEREFKGGDTLALNIREEVIFYSKKGHYVRAAIDDALEEGEVTLNNMMYQKISGKTASVHKSKIANVKMFPNPIASGQTLTIASEFSLNEYIIDVYTINGQKVNTLHFSESNNHQYQTRVPENLASGLYFYKVHDKKGAIFTNGKIQIK
ncbi:T9SS type A sorting domain-containing protein [uncultured Polaribacter sp.]|uniref:T9SS type A sorting domain-containing protein n=1 Tax=uncultured Polaribacter sp. TaxID=174711 RepID=UPI0026017DE5|nr:T9SS type A sorting domain-containing protein [uncultured Polaribacter sp.]